tara:strand:+ start:37 stop:252 length:216 start_codon:yes stop_codon:yes gene_type:complete
VGKGKNSWSSYGKKEKEEKEMKLWCRVKQPNGKWFYVYVDKEMAMALCLKQGYEIKCDPPPNGEPGEHDAK